MEVVLKAAQEGEKEMTGFQMPLHCPRYKRKDYGQMPEWMVDRLLLEYRLLVTGDVQYKRSFAMGAFLWD